MKSRSCDPTHHHNRNHNRRDIDNRNESRSRSYSRSRSRSRSRNRNGNNRDNASSSLSSSIEEQLRERNDSLAVHNSLNVNNNLNVNNLPNNNHGHNGINRMPQYQPPPAPILGPQPAPFPMLPFQERMQSFSNQMNLMGQQMQQTMAAIPHQFQLTQQFQLQQQHPIIPNQQNQQNQIQTTEMQNIWMGNNRNNAIHRVTMTNINDNDNNHNNRNNGNYNNNETHLHLYGANGEYIHYVVTGPFSINNGVVVAHNGGTVRRIMDDDNNDNNNNNNNDDDDDDDDEDENENKDDRDSIIKYLPVRRVRENEENEDIQCRICMDTYKANESVMTLPCFHSFHNECVSIWLRDRNYCPICRHSINHFDVDQDHNDENNSNHNNHNNDNNNFDPEPQ